MCHEKLLDAHLSFNLNAFDAPITAFQTLNLNRRESNNLKAYLSTSPDSLPGYIECWVNVRHGQLVQWLPDPDIEGYDQWPLRQPNYCPFWDVLNMVRVEIHDFEDDCQQLEWDKADLSRPGAGSEVEVMMGLEILSKTLDCLRVARADMEEMEDNIQRFETLREEERPCRG